MCHLVQLIERFLIYFREERGATATEYSLLISFIALIIVTGVGIFGIALNGVFLGLGTGLKTALGIP